MPPPIALIALSPLTFHGWKLALDMKNRPTVAMNPTATNLITVVTTWTEPMFLTPERLIRAGTHSPTSTSRTESPFVVALVDEDLDVEHPTDRDCGVTRPRGDPVRPGVDEADRVAVRHPGVGVGTAVGREPPRQARRTTTPAREPRPSSGPSRPA